MLNFCVPKGVRAVERTFAAGDTIMRDYEEYLGLYLLLEGTGEVMFRDENGELLRISHYAAPDLFGEIELLSDRRQSTFIMAESFCRVLIIPANDAMHWLRQDFSFCRAVMQRMAEKLHDITLRYGDMCFLDQKERYLRAVRRHAARAIWRRSQKPASARSLGCRAEALTALWRSVPTRLYIRKGILCCGPLSELLWRSARERGRRGKPSLVLCIDVFPPAFRQESFTAATAGCKGAARLVIRYKGDINTARVIKYNGNCTI